MAESRNQYRKALYRQYEMVERGEYHDFTIIVEGKTFHVHKLVLGTRSPYFATLFSTQMKETVENTLELSDINVDIFEIFLKYIYTCDISDVQKYAEKLMLCGEKYQMQDLVEVCEVSLTNTLNVENAASCLLLGHLLMRPALKSHSLSLIRRKWNDVVNTEGWENLISNHSLMTELGSALFPQINSRTPVGTLSSAHGTRTWAFTYDMNRVTDHYYIQSPLFSLSDEEDSLSWKFSVELEQEKMFLYLVHVGMNVTVPPIWCSFAFKRSDSPKIVSHAVETTCCFRVNSFCSMKLFRWPVDCSSSRYRQAIEICVHMSINSSSYINYQQPINYFHEYLEKSCFTDAIIDLEGETFSVHKVVLSAASPVFAEIFNVDKERYHLDGNVGSQTFKELLALIYNSGEALNSIDLSLLKAVDHYRLNEKFKNRCRVAILRVMNNDNVMDILIHCENSGDRILKQLMLKYICKNYLNLSASPCWEIMKDHPQIHGELLRFMTSRLRDFS